MAAHRLAVAGLCLAALLPLPLVPASAQAPRPPAPAAAPPAPVDPALEAAQKIYDALPEAERKAIQENLIWTGDFTGAGTGGFGPLTMRGIVAFQKRAGAKPDGILQPKERAALADAAAKARQAVKFSRVSDPRNGSRIGVPLALVDKSAPTRSGTRFTSADGGVVLETAGADGNDLTALYDLLKNDGPGRKVTYKVLRPDFFVVAGQQGDKRFYTRFGTTPAGLRGYSFSYPVSRAKDLDRIAIAVANSFEAVPAPAAPAPGGAALAVAAPAAPAVPALPAPLANGIVVAPGKVLTVTAVEGCPAPAVGTAAATVEKADRAAGLVLLDVPGLRARPLPVRDARPEEAAPLVVMGFAPAPSAPQLAVAAAEARLPAGGTLRLFAPLQPGGAGSPVFDRHGSLVGLVASVANPPRQVAGITPQASYPVAASARLLAFLAAAGQAVPAAAPAPSGTSSAGAIAAEARGSVVAIDCRR